MKWPKATQGLLFNLALLTWLLPVGTDIHEEVGTPLSDAEYEEFFKTFNGPHRVGAICFLRAVYGCKQPLIQMVDRYENHGLIPEGRVCSSSAKRPRFPDFCTLTLYRCAMRKYFVKRILCPGETIETSTDTHTINQEAEPLHNLSFILQSLPKLLHSSSATATTPSTPNASPRSESPIAVVSAMSVSAMVIREVSLDLTTVSPPAESTAGALPASAESVLDLLFHTTTEKESVLELLTESPPQSLVPTDATTTSELHPETHPEIHPETHPEIHPETHPEIHPEPHPELHPEPHPEIHPETPPEPHPELQPEPQSELQPEPQPEVHPEPQPELHPEQNTTPSAPELLVATSPATTTTEPVLDLLLESSLELLSPTAAKTDIETLLENLTATEAATVTEASPPSTTSPETTTTSPESVAEFSTSISNAESMPEVSTILEATTTSGSISTHPARVAGKKKNSEEPSPATSSATTTESPSELPTHNTISAAPVRHEYDSTTCMNHLHQSPTALCHPHTSAPSATASLDPAKHPPQSNSSMGIVVVSTFIHHRPEGTLGLIPLLRIGMRSPNLQHEQGSPGLQQLPPHGLKRLFLRMQDHRVQHLMHEMRDLMSKGEIVQKQKLQATSLQLLRALNLPNQQRRFKRSMRLKR